MELKHTITIKSPGKNLTAKLTEPDIMVYGAAQAAGTTSTGKFDIIAAGKVVFDFCAKEGDIETIKKDVKAYAAACLDCYGLLSFYESEIKKN